MIINEQGINTSLKNSSQNSTSLLRAPSRDCACIRTRFDITIFRILCFLILRSNLLYFMETSDLNEVVGITSTPQQINALQERAAIQTQVQLGYVNEWNRTVANKPELFCWNMKTLGMSRSLHLYLW